MVKLKNYFSLIGVLLFIIILLRIDFLDVLESFEKLSLVLLLSVLFMRFLYVLVKSYVWRYIMKLKGIDYSIKDSFLIYSVGLYLGFVTPGRIGDFSKVLYLKNDGNDVAKSFSTVFLDRLLDLGILFSLGYFSMFFFFNYFKREIFWISLFLGVGLVILAILFLRRDFAKKILQKVFGFFIPKKFSKYESLFIDVYNELFSIRWSDFVLVFLGVLVAWWIYFFQLFLVAIGLGIEISFIYLVVCLSIAAILTLIPISMSGIGTRDLTLIFLFSLIGISKEVAISFSVIFLFLMAFAAFVGFLCFLRKPISKIF